MLFYKVHSNKAVCWSVNVIISNQKEWEIFDKTIAHNKGIMYDEVGPHKYPLVFKSCRKQPNEAGKTLKKAIKKEFKFLKKNGVKNISMEKTIRYYANLCESVIDEEDPND